MSPEVTSLRAAVKAAWAEVEVANAEAATLRVARYAPHKTKRALFAAKLALGASYAAGDVLWGVWFKAKAALADAELVTEEGKAP